MSSNGTGNRRDGNAHPRPGSVAGGSSKRERGGGERERVGRDPYDTSRRLDDVDGIELFRRRRAPNEANRPPEREKRQKLEIQDTPPAGPDGEKAGYDPYDTVRRRRPHWPTRTRR